MTRVSSWAWISAGVTAFRSAYSHLMLIKNHLNQCLYVQIWSCLKIKLLLTHTNKSTQYSTNSLFSSKIELDPNIQISVSKVNIWFSFWVKQIFLFFVFFCLFFCKRPVPVLTHWWMWTSSIVGLQFILAVKRMKAFQRPEKVHFTLNGNLANTLLYILFHSFLYIMHVIQH